MIVAPKTITLKNGKTATLCSPCEEDAQALLDYLKTTAGETEFILRYPEECTLTVEQELAYINGTNSSPDNAVIVCKVEGKLAGNCHIARHNRIKTKHRADVMIALVKDYWNLGIGTAMFEEMISIAKEWGISQLELEVIEGNERGMALYKKMGFEVVAERPNSIKLKDGTILSEFIMIKELP